MQKIANIQVMRGMAALAVTLFHIAGTQEKEGLNGWLFSPFKEWGSWGVDLFFIISGYVMAVSLSKGNDTAAHFLLKRFIRIYPLYFVLTVLYCLISIVAPRLFTSFKLNPEWLLASLSFTSGYAGFGEPILGQGWTLEFEALFYLSIGIAVVLRQNHRLEYFTLAVLLGLCLFGVNSIILEFGFGMMASRFKNVFHNLLSVRFFLIAFGIASLVLHRFIEIEFVPRFLLFGIPCTSIFLGFLLISPIKNRFFLYLGEISYSIYLVQFFVIPVFFKFLKSDFNSELYGDIRGVLAILTILLSSHLTYTYIELKSAKFLKKSFKLI